MLPGELKPILTALVMPPAAPLILALLGVLVATWRRGLGLVLATIGIAATYLLSTNGMALVLARHLMPEVRAVQPRELQATQAIVVLGGGVLPQAPEYGIPQPGPHTLQRLRYASWLAKKTGKPVAFAGGVGWAAIGTETETEGTVARRVLQEEYGLTLKWMDDRSRDTAENALRMAQLLQPAGVRRIAVVSDATHIPRAVAAFRAAGFEVIAAPTDLPFAEGRPELRWLPSSTGATTTRSLLREWLGRFIARHA